MSHPQWERQSGVGDEALPRPDASGEVMGWDLKKVTPASGSAWVMLLGVDFASNKLFAWDLDTDKAKLQGVQGVMHE
mgnify:CR=1 FL=1